MARVEQVCVFDSHDPAQRLLSDIQAAQAAYARDVGAGLVKPGSSSGVSVPKPPVSTKPTKASSNPFENYSTAESLGYTDPDAARLQAEAERRRQEGVAGDWEIVATEEPPASPGAGWRAGWA